MTSALKYSIAASVQRCLQPSLCPLVCPCRAVAALPNPQDVDDDMHMNVAAVVMPVRVGAYNGLVSGEMCLAKFLAQRLRPVYGQAVVCASRGSKLMM